ncbi:amidohydrolase family protein [Streptomyces sp. KL116D]|uniref:amidohydrolase family protein n=1 Tax=Streptomyces sp. KL116D TaxID=3045152 RepID=UPI003557C430
MAERLPDITEYRLADMDANGVATVQVLSLTRPGYRCSPTQPSPYGTRRAANDALAGIIAAHPTRFGGLAALPLQDPGAAVAEARRAIRDLGMAGFLVSGHTNGHYLDEPQFRPVWSALEELGRPLPAPHSGADRAGGGCQDRPGKLVGPALQLGGRGGRTRAAHPPRRRLRRLPGARLMRRPHGRVPPVPRPPARRPDPQHHHPRPSQKAPSAYFGDNISVTTSGVMDDTMLRAPPSTSSASTTSSSPSTTPSRRGEQAVTFLRRAPLTPTQRRKIAHGSAERILRL